MATDDDLVLLKQIDPRIEEIALTVNCNVWNEKRSYQVLDALLYIVKRTVEPRVQIILKPALPIDNVEFCVSSSLICFNNHEDSTRAQNCIQRLVDPTGGIEDEQRGSGVASGPLYPSTHVIVEHINNEEQGVANDAFDKNVYLQNSRVIMAMIAVLLATIVLSVGLNPPSTITASSVKIIYQITFWITAVFSLAALLILGMVTPTSYDMQLRIFRRAFISISVALICIVVAFCASMVTMETNLVVRIVGGFISGIIGIIFFSYYFTSKMVRDLIFREMGFRLTQDEDDNPYSLTCF